MSEPNAKPPESPYRFLRIAVAVLLGLLAIAGLKSYRDLAQVRAQEAALEQRITATRNRTVLLTDRLERIRHDPATLERLAREEIGMVRPQELVIVLPEER